MDLLSGVQQQNADTNPGGNGNEVLSAVLSEVQERDTD